MKIQPRRISRKPTTSGTSRSVALEVIRAVHLREAYANLELPLVLRTAGLSASDAAFATELCYGTLRMRGLYDAVIAHAAARPVTEIDDVVLDILRLGAHQSLALSTPAHAVVDESVRLARQNSRTGAAGFTNAVMRRVTERSRVEWIGIVSEGLSPDEHLAVEFSHPAWIVRALRSALAHEESVSELEELLNADNVPARVSLVRLAGASQLANSQPGTYSPRAMTLQGGDPRDIHAVKANDVRVQDEGSQLAALVLARCRPISSRERWLDLCAGPGGKTAVLAAETVDTGVEIVANEVSSHRAELVRRAVANFSHVRVVEGDGRELSTEVGQLFDRILVDAPCSGLGALRRRPEARWRRTTADVSELVQLQLSLLRRALEALRPGGVVAYVTCSPHLVETRAVISRVLAADSRVTELDARSVIAEFVRSPLDLRGTDKSVQLWPHRHGTDAMFIALLTRAE